MNKTKTLQLLPLLLAGTLAAAPAIAQRNSGNPRSGAAGGTTGGTRGQTTPKTTTPPKTNPAPTTPTTPQTAVIQAELDNASEALDALVQQQTDAYEQTPDFLAARKNAIDAADAYETAKAAVLAALPAKDPTYKAAKGQQAAGEKKIIVLKDVEAPAADIDAATQALTDIQTTVTSLETKAADADPSLAAPKAKLTDALAKMHKMQADFTQALTLTPDYIAAKLAVDTARAKLAAATTK